MVTEIFGGEVFAEEIDTPPTFEAIAQVLGQHREELLKKLYEADQSVVNTGVLREETSVPRGSILNHLERLDQWGLAEEQDRRMYHDHGGHLARAWELTPRGWSFYLAEIADPKTIREELGPQRKELLGALFDADSSVLTTANLREDTSVPDGSTIHHLEQLKERDLVEERDRQKGPSSAGELPRTWELTSRGEAIYSAQIDDSESEVRLPDLPEMVAGHELRLNELEEEVNKIGTLVVKIAMDTGTISEEEGEELLEQREGK